MIRITYATLRKHYAVSQLPNRSHVTFCSNNGPSGIVRPVFMWGNRSLRRITLLLLLTTTPCGSSSAAGARCRPRGRSKDKSCEAGRGRYPWIRRVADILAPAAAAAPPIGRVAGARVTVMSSLFSRELLRVQCELA